MALSGSKSYTLTIGNGPLAITIGGPYIPPLVLMRQVMRKPPTLSLSPYQG